MSIYLDLVMLGILSGLPFQVPSIAAEQPLPNVLLIYVDDMGYNGLTLEAIRRGPWKLHLPRKAAHRVYWAQHPKKIYLNLDHAVLNQLADDISEKRDLLSQHPEQTDDLRKLAAKMRLELGDWNMDGTDRPAFSYPGNLNSPNWKRKRQSAPAGRRTGRNNE